MNKIKKLESLLSDWKAAKDYLKAGGFQISTEVRVIKKLEAALEIIKEPSNTQLQSDINTGGFCKECESLTVTECLNCGAMY